MKIIVTGPLGNISRPLAEELIRKNHTVTVVSSRPERASGIEAMGAIPAIGTMEDAAFLAETFISSERILISSRKIIL